MPADARKEVRAVGLDDIMAAVARLDGKVDANFQTIFKRQERHDATMAEILQRLAGLEKVNEIEADAGDDKGAERPRIKGWQWAAVVAACVSALGGMSAAFEQGWRIVAAVIQALHQTPPPSA